jgi:hypothetical protein
MKAEKPFARKMYGSIPHLPGSKYGDKGDHGCPPGEAKLFTQHCKDGDKIIVTEKLDGSSVAVAKKDGQIIALNRAGYPCISSPYLQHRYFSMWVDERRDEFNDLLQDNEWICGEWLAQAHGTIYELRPFRGPFVAFDMFRLKEDGNGERLLYHEFTDRVYNAGFIPYAPILWYDYDACSIENALKALGPNGHYGALEEAEGAVWRIERNGKCHALAKYVRHEKIPGKYLDGVTGKEPIWNWLPKGVRG